MNRRARLVLHSLAERHTSSRRNSKEVYSVFKDVDEICQINYKGFYMRIRKEGFIYNRANSGDSRKRIKMTRRLTNISRRGKDMLS